MARRDRQTGPGLDGILVIAKPAGPTSHDIVALVRRLAATKRVGHGGTLDPFAAGVLPVFLGRATRLVEYHLGDRKRYRATVCFGAASTTDDLEGELTPSGTAPSRAAVEEALRAFLGPIEQRPPDYSAVRIAGRRAYAMARAGETVDLAPRTVTIHAMEVVEWIASDPARPVAVVDVECSAGTYIRALARDLGERTGSAAYLGALTRTASGPFRLDDAVPLDDVRAAATGGPGGLTPLLLPIDSGLDHFPELVLQPDEVAAISRGQYVRVSAMSAGPADGRPIRLRDTDGRLVAIALARAGRLAPEKVLVDPPAASRVASDESASGPDRASEPAAPTADESAHAGEG
jgi:tRNA pseudouridine55 synthase